jgi:hypothetical protein
MGAIAMCNCNKSADNNELDLDKRGEDEKKIPLKSGFTFHPEFVSEENGISPKLSGDVDVDSASQKLGKKTHQKTLSNEIVVEIDDDNK